MAINYSEMSYADLSKMLCDRLGDWLTYISLAYSRKASDLKINAEKTYRDEIFPLVRHLKQDSTWIKGFAEQRRFNETIEYLDYTWTSIQKNKFNEAIPQLNIALAKWKEFMKMQGI